LGAKRGVVAWQRRPETGFLGGPAGGMRRTPLGAALRRVSRHVRRLKLRLRAGAERGSLPDTIDRPLPEATVLRAGILSYMLSSPEIEEAKRQNRLFPVKPTDAWTGKPRAFLMCVPLRDELETGKRDANEKVRQRWAKLEAAMIHFVEKGRMTNALMKQLKPPKHEHWELLSRKPRPSLRVFGRFALPDVFIGTHVKPRKGMGGMWSQQFELEKLVCEDHYKVAGLTTVFTDAPHFRYTRYITENATATIRVQK
jgi:hypothetical protein